MASAFIHYEQSEIHYLYHGKGSINIVCLHGYGEDATSFDILKEHLPSAYNLIAIDLPFHGATIWNETRPFAVEDLVSVLQNIFSDLALLQQHFVLLGFSMGGRVAMSLLQHIPEKIIKLVLLAPDGLKVSPWYWFATQTRKGNQIFRFTMSKPIWLNKMLLVSNRFKLINKSAYKFIRAYIEDDTTRDELYHRWTCMRTFKPDIKKIRTIIQQKKIAVNMLYGRHDRIIQAKNGIKLREGIEPLCKVHVIDAGHNILQQKYAGIIAKLVMI